MTNNQLSPNADLKGYLLRYETIKGRTGWKQRWAVLCDFCLYLYRDPADKECFYALLLPSSKVTQSYDDSGKFRNSIKVEEPNQPPVYLSADTDMEFQMWYEALACSALLKKPHQMGLDMDSEEYVQQLMLRSETGKQQAETLQNGGASMTLVSESHEHSTTRPDYLHLNGSSRSVNAVENITHLLQDDLHRSDQQNQSSTVVTTTVTSHESRHQESERANGSQDLRDFRASQQSLRAEGRAMRTSQSSLHKNGDRYSVRTHEQNHRGSQPTIANEGFVVRTHEKTQRTVPSIVTNESYAVRTHEENHRGSQPMLANEGFVVRSQEQNHRGSQPKIATDSYVVRTHEENNRVSQPTIANESYVVRTHEQNHSGSQPRIATDSYVVRNHEENRRGSQPRIATDSYVVRSHEENRRGSQPRIVNEIRTHEQKHQVRQPAVVNESYTVRTHVQPARTQHTTLTTERRTAGQDYRGSQQSLRSTDSRPKLSGSAHSLRDMGESGSYRIGGTSHQEYSRRAIETVREDPHMSESHVIATAPLDEIRRKYPVSGLAKRMSIAASDLLGKSHDELLILLIQLNREKSCLERRRDYCIALLKQQPHMQAAPQTRSELDDLKHQIDLSQPLINFIENIVSLGALYNGDDIMFASEYRQHLLSPEQLVPVKTNVDFVRRQQEKEVSKQFFGDQMDGAPVSMISAESQEFTKTRKQLEEELDELQKVYIDYHQKKSNLGSFMTDLSRTGITVSQTKQEESGNKSSLIRGTKTNNVSMRGGGGPQSMYLETDMDSGRTVDMAAKFPRRGYYTKSVRERDHPEIRSRTMSQFHSSGYNSNQQYENLPRSQTLPPSQHKDQFDHREGTSRSATTTRVVQENSNRSRQQTGRYSPQHDDVFVRNSNYSESYEPARQAPIKADVGYVTKTTYYESSGHRDRTPSPTPLKRATAEEFLSRSHQQYQRSPSPEAVTTMFQKTYIADSGSRALSTTSSSKFPDPEEFLKTRNLPLGSPAPDQYRSQPHLAQGSELRVSNQNHSVSVQEQLNNLLGGSSPPAVRSTKQYVEEVDYVESSRSKPLLKMDPSRYKRGAAGQYSGGTEGRDQALEGLARFAEGMQGMKEGTYQRADANKSHSGQLQISTHTSERRSSFTRINTGFEESSVTSEQVVRETESRSIDEDMGLGSVEDRKERMRRLVAGFSMQEYSSADTAGLSLAEERQRREQVLYERELIGREASHAAVTGYLR